jgi:hypothetical protein
MMPVSRPPALAQVLYSRPKAATEWPVPVGRVVDRTRALLHAADPALDFFKARCRPWVKGEGGMHQAYTLP